MVWVFSCAFAVALLLVAEWRGWRLLACFAKPAASASFVAAALSAGATDSPYGRWLLAGLILAALGDVLLLARQGTPFRLGIYAFLGGHLAYASAFLRAGSTLPCALVALAAAAPAGYGALKWLEPHLPAGMQAPVRAYIAVITIMLVTAAAAAPADWRITAGATAFYCSDLSVARDRFVRPGLVNRLWGLPLYYTGQLLLALTAGHA
ncbi:MAG: lysoplasmalogenase [Candidatus Dadabacteria bacterium]|nr:MAG: lysoplasmalogenase [Candidatus Dadabacteria bacterium]